MEGYRMTVKRCCNYKNFEAIEDQSFTDNQNGKIYYAEDFDEIINLLNNKDKRIKELEAENAELRQKLFEAR